MFSSSVSALSYVEECSDFADLGMLGCRCGRKQQT
jgi:hypothetical protein